MGRSVMADQAAEDIKAHRADILRRFYAYKTSFMDRAEAQQDTEAVRLAWEIVAESKPLIYWVLGRDKGITSTILYDLNDAESYLVEVLYDATWNHEPSLGTFATYVVSCLRYQLIQFKTKMRVQRSPFTAPAQITSRALDFLSKYRQAIEQERFSSDDYSKISDRLAVYDRHVAVLAGNYVNVKKLKVRDHEGFFAGERSPMELAIDEDSDPQESPEVHQADQARLLSLALETLSPKEAFVIRARFGLGDFHEHTLNQVGRVLNLTQERIRQIEKQALKKLRNPIRSTVLRGLL
jgi:RNA polymerase sigma factor (sigma-70 family)